MFSAWVGWVTQIILLFVCAFSPSSPPAPAGQGAIAAPVRPAICSSFALRSPCCVLGRGRRSSEAFGEGDRAGRGGTRRRRMRRRSWRRASGEGDRAGGDLPTVSLSEASLLFHRGRLCREAKTGAVGATQGEEAHGIVDQQRRIQNVLGHLEEPVFTHVATTCSAARCISAALPHMAGPTSTTGASRLQLALRRGQRGCPILQLALRRGSKGR